MKIYNAILILFLALAPFDLYACSCKALPIEERVSLSDFVYLGRVVEAKLNLDGSVTNSLSVIEHIKGHPEHNLLVSYTNTESCSLLAAVGVVYLVFGNIGYEPKLSGCTTTQPVDLEDSTYLDHVRSAANKTLKDDAAARRAL